MMNDECRISNDEVNSHFDIRNSSFDIHDSFVITMPRLSRFNAKAWKDLHNNGNSQLAALVAPVSYIRKPRRLSWSFDLVLRRAAKTAYARLIISRQSAVNSCRCNWSNCGLYVEGEFGRTQVTACRTPAYPCGYGRTAIKEAQCLLNLNATE